jgi:hypothetical protein
LVSPRAGTTNVFYRGNVIYLLYTDDSILAGPDEDELNDVEDIKAAGLDVTDEGDIEDFLGVNIEKIDDDTYHLSAAPPDRSNHSGPTPGSGLNGHQSTPASSNVINAYTSSEPFDEHFHYRSVIGSLTTWRKAQDQTYPTQCTCARYSSNPKMEHGQAVKWIGKLKGTRDKLATSSDHRMSRSLSGPTQTSVEIGTPRRQWMIHTARSRSGYIISYLGIPIVWKSLLQTEIALSSCNRNTSRAKPLGRRFQSSS